MNEEIDIQIQKLIEDPNLAVRRSGDCFYLDDLRTNSSIHMTYDQVRRVGKALDNAGSEEDFEELIEQDDDFSDIDPRVGDTRPLQGRIPETDIKGLWLKKNCEFASFEVGHFKYVEHGVDCDVYVTFDTYTLDVIWTEGEDVAFAKINFTDLQDRYPDLYGAADVKALAKEVVDNGDTEDFYEGDAEELRSDPVEYIPFVTTIKEL